MDILTFRRPDKQTTFKEIEYILTLSAKEVVQITWEALNPSKNGCIVGSELRTFWKTLLNLKSIDEADKCRVHLQDLGIIGYLSSEGYYRVNRQ